MMMSRTARTLSLILFAGLCTLVLNLAAAPETPPSPEFVGQKKCKKCHIKQYKTWSKTKHALSFDGLSEKYQKNDECLKCHTTGMGTGGFESVEKTPHLLGVQCEQCHGPGSDHIPLTTKLKKDKVEKDAYPEDLKINRKPTGCTDCHNPHVKHEHIDEDADH